MSRRTPLLLLALAACSLRPHEFTASDAAASATTEPAGTSDAAITAAPVTGEPTGPGTTTTTGEPAPATTTGGAGTSNRRRQPRRERLHRASGSMGGCVSSERGPSSDPARRPI